MMSPKGVTRFCSGILLLLLPALCGEKVGMRGSFRKFDRQKRAGRVPLTRITSAM